MKATDTQSHVLLVEDEHLIRQLWIEQLEDTQRFRISGVAAAGAALAVLSRESVDAAIIDIGLPEMSGEALIAIVRSIYPRLPILAVTGFDAVHYRHLADSGIPVLQKPFRSSWLLFHLNALLVRQDCEVRRVAPVVCFGAG